jgi:hypothetical protein
MRIEFFEHPLAGAIAREDASDGEFFVRDDGTVCYRNVPARDVRFVSANESVFRQAVAAFHRYNADVVTTRDEEGQMVFVRRLVEDLQALGALPGSPEAFWPLIVEQAEHGML